MINHHPKFELIKAFVNGDLPASLSAGVAIHADMCPVCQQTIAQFTEQVAETSFEEEYLDRFIVDDNEALDAVAAIDFDHMIDEIVQSSDISIALPKVEKTISFDDKIYTIPTALNSMELGKHAHICLLYTSDAADE